ncbi:MAG TPA: hypothetical protein VHH32_06730, partial [Gemmatimonadales bacterium]|nr:hypothetical protein [Gemmatimonadales bacterium]
MATGFRTGVLVAAWLIAGLTHPTASAAQWSLALEIGSERYWGGSVDNSPERFSFRPHRPTILGAGLEHRSGAFGAALRLRYTD